MKKLSFLLPLIGTVCLTSCSNAPKCHYTGASSALANAGCLVVYNNKLLIVEDNNSRMSLPGGSKETGEVAQCTAEREVWEETGIEVKASKNVTTFKNGFQLFACEIVGKQILDGSARPWRFEVNEIHWIGLDQFEDKIWRFPDQVELMKHYLATFKN